MTCACSGGAEYRIISVCPKRRIVFVEDLNTGAMSVTNDAQSVYESIHMDYPDHRVVYRDSERMWGEIVPPKSIYLDWAFMDTPERP